MQFQPKCRNSFPIRLLGLSRSEIPNRLCLARAMRQVEHFRLDTLDKMELRELLNKRFLDEVINHSHNHFSVN